ncbi:hypothetical protein DYB34_006661 [Aphanomyces astaci]|uniref:Uncharacterized protein n=1 Tax=Aphanomyces astaci TaxID=112090 RepID=A0A418BWG4_APHAT|nr:hypothetical protein DYB34_006661 [Aphanomyces astaci]
MAPLHTLLVPLGLAAASTAPPPNKRTDKSKLSRYLAWLTFLSLTSFIFHPDGMIWVVLHWIVQQTHSLLLRTVLLWGWDQHSVVSLVVAGLTWAITLAGAVATGRLYYVYIHPNDDGIKCHTPSPTGFSVAKATKRPKQKAPPKKGPPQYFANLLRSPKTCERTTPAPSPPSAAPAVHTFEAASYHIRPPTLRLPTAVQQDSHTCCLAHPNRKRPSTCDIAPLIPNTNESFCDTVSHLVPDTTPMAPASVPTEPDTPLPSIPDSAPTVPDSFPLVLDTTPTVPDIAPAVPDIAPVVPDVAPAVPDTDPAVPDTDPIPADLPDLEYTLEEDCPETNDSDWTHVTEPTLTCADDQSIRHTASIYSGEEPNNNNNQQQQHNDNNIPTTIEQPPSSPRIVTKADLMAFLRDPTLTASAIRRHVMTGHINAVAVLALSQREFAAEKVPPLAVRMLFISAMAATEDRPSPLSALQPPPPSKAGGSVLPPPGFSAILSQDAAVKSHHQKQQSAMGFGTCQAQQDNQYEREMERISNQMTMNVLD